MKIPRTIAILFHTSYRHLETHTFIIREVALEWDRCGIKVYGLKGTDVDFDADLLVVQVDLTVIPNDYVQIFKRYPCVFNGTILDISKRKISTNLVQSGDDYAGKVIVKTNNNFGGFREQREHGGKPSPSDDLTSTSCIRPDNYQVFDSINSLPSGVFSNPALVVEKFLPERDGDLYCIRSYTFGGSRGWCTLRKSHKPIVKGRGTVERQIVDVHPKVLEVQQQLGLDFGKIDYVMHDGEATVLDVTRTPTYPDGPRTDQQLSWAKGYAEGLLSLFSQRTC